MESGSECQGEGAEVVCGRAGVCGLCGQWVCAARAVEGGVAGGDWGGGGESGRGDAVGWTGGDGQYGGGDGLFDDCEGGFGGVRGVVRLWGGGVCVRCIYPLFGDVAWG